MVQLGSGFGFTYNDADDGNQYEAKTNFNGHKFGYRTRIFMPMEQELPANEIDNFGLKDILVL